MMKCKCGTRIRPFRREGQMGARRFWLATFGGLFVLIELVAVAAYIKRSAHSQSLSTKSVSPAAVTNAPFVSELTRDCRVKSTGLPEAMAIAAARAKSLFRTTRWDEFVVIAERAGGPTTWRVRIEPKSGERDDRMWVNVQHNE